ncbi:MAG: choice-of-anchor V domain-containing protein, partial [Ignavibacteria bacterium]
MKKIILSQTSFIGAAAFIIVLFSSIFIYAFSTGIDGRTLKSTAIGCSCHASALDPGVIVFISGPDTVITGQTATYTIEVSESSKSGAGIDVSTRNGVLGVIDAQTHLSNGEVVQSSNIPMTNHAVIIQFSYTAPGFATTDTIWATGLATNSNGSLNNDIWNWAPSKRV